MNTEYSGITGRVEIISPAVAREMLKCNTKNRTPREAHVRFLEREMRGGRWHVTGQGPVFADTGVLVNGQHTLKAIERSGMTVPVFVIRGVSADSYLYFDAGSPRTAADLLQAFGVDVSPTNLAASLRLYDLYETERLGADGYAATKMSNAEVLDLATEYPEIKEHVGKHSLPVSTRVATVASAILTKAGGAETADAFLQQLGSGANLVDGDPLLTLRNQLLSERAKKVKRTAGVHLAWIIQAWNFRCLGKTRKRPFECLIECADFPKPVSL